MQLFQKHYYQLFILLFVIGNYTFAQSDFYYFDNERFYIEKDLSRVSVNVSDTIAINSYSSFFKSRTKFSENYNRVIAQTQDSLALLKKNNKNYYTELEVNDSIAANLTDYTNFLNLLNGDTSIIKASQAYTTTDNNILGLTNYFYVKLPAGPENNLEDGGRPTESAKSLLQNAVTSHNLELIGELDFMSQWHIVAVNSSNPENAIYYSRIFHDTGHFLAVEPEFAHHDIATTADPYFSQQWGLKNTGQYGGWNYIGLDIDAENAWNSALGTGVNVAIFDEGVQIAHPDLVANIAGSGFDCKSFSSPAQLWGDHGTPVAGIVGAVQDNSEGISGVAPNSNLIPISYEPGMTTQVEFATGFDWAVNNNIDVINCSWGFFVPQTLINDAVNFAMQNGRNGNGCVVVFASGNENDRNIRHPQKFNFEALVVGAMTPCGERKYWSANGVSCDSITSWGSSYGETLDIMAPGVNIPSTDRTGSNGYNRNGLNGYGTNINYVDTWGGTSAAAPHAAGVAALILEINPCLKQNEVVDIIESTARKIGSYNYAPTSGRSNGNWNEEMGYGLLDASAAVNLAQNYASTFVDLMIKDNSIDTGSQPNTTTSIMWHSPDIWIRNVDDGGTDHQNPEYSALGNPNFINVRIQNRGCIDSDGTDVLKMYWAKASTALGYPDPWFGGVTYPGSGASMGDPLPPVNIPVIPAGNEAIITIPWVVPDPALYGNDGNQWHFCLLAQIESQLDPIQLGLGATLNENVLDNNNMAWKNVTIVDAIAGNSIEPGGVVTVGNPVEEPEMYFLELEVAELETGKPIYLESEVHLEMDNILYNAWVRGGEIAQELESTENDEEKVVRGDNVILDNISFDPLEVGSLKLTFNFLTEELTNKPTFVYHVIQREWLTGEIVGGETFIINKETRPIFFAEADDEWAYYGQEVTLTAQDIGEEAIYRWYGDEDELLFEGIAYTIDEAYDKTYTLEVTATSDGYKDYAEVEIKTLPSEIIQIYPNPGSNIMQVDYTLNNITEAKLMISSVYLGNQNGTEIDLNESQDSIQIDISTFSTGFYTLSLITDGIIVDAKTIIKN